MNLKGAIVKAPFAFRGSRSSLAASVSLNYVEIQILDVHHVQVPRSGSTKNKWLAARGTRLLCWCRTSQIRPLAPDELEHSNCELQG